MGIYNSYEALCDGLMHEYRNIAASTIEESEEGNILYFIKRHKHFAEEDSVISMAKIYSSEFLMVRSLKKYFNKYLE